MAQREIQFTKGAYYHIFNRGAHRASIFRREQDYFDVIALMKKYAKKYSVTFLCYCLMPNHYHWFIRQDGDIPARLLPQHVFNGYVKSFNLRNNHSGTLFEGTFKAILIKDTTHLRHLCRYIHGNPVKDGFAAFPELWPYSNYLEWIGKREGELVDHQFITDFFPKVENYPRWVANYLAGVDKVPTSLQYYFNQFDESESL